jgi:hypothetical protein
MATNYNPRTVTDGLVLALDGGNIKSFKGEATTNELLDIIWGSDGGGGGTLVTDNNLKYNGYPTYYYTPGTSLNSYLYGGDLDSSRTSTVWTFSCYVKREDGAPITSLNVYMYYPNSDGYGAGTIQDVGNGWYRISRTRTGASSYISLCGFTGFASGVKYYLSGAQLEKKSYATTYVSTNTTRGTTVATGGGWADLSGNGNNGELVNGPTYSSANVGSLVFDGVDDGVNIPHNSNIDIRSQITIECLFYLNSFTPGGPNTDKITLITKAYSYYMTINLSGKIDVYFYGTGGYYSSNSSVNLNQWTQVVVTFNGSNINWYINGIIDKSLSQSGTITPVRNGDLGVGREVFENYGRGMNGRISKASIYNRALTAAEVSQNFNAIKSRYFRDGDGSSVGNAAPSASYLVSLGITTNGYYYINLPTVGPTLIYCILDPAVDGGGWMVLWGAAQGSTDYTYSFSANRDDTSNLPINGFYSLSYAKRSAINALCTQNKTLVYAGSNSNWLRFDGYMWNSNSHTSGDFRFEFNSSLVTSNGTVDSSVKVGLTNYNVGAGGDFGIAINTDGLDHHSGSYYNLNGGCVNMYLYQYYSGYKVNTALSGWYNQTSGCNYSNSNELPLLVAMK